MGLDARHDDRCHARSCVPSGETSAACRIRVRAVEYFMHVMPEFPDDIAMVGLPAHVFKRAFVSPPPLFDGLLLIIPPI